MSAQVLSPTVYPGSAYSPVPAPPCRRRSTRSSNNSCLPTSSVGSAPEAGESSNSRPPEVSLSSSCRFDKISSIFATFDGQKSSLVLSTGFGGLLKMQLLKTPHNDLALWLYKRFDYQRMCLHLDGGVELYLTEADVHLIFGIPFEGRPVKYDKNQGEETVRAFNGKLCSQNTPPSLTLSFLEDILTKEYGFFMSDHEIDAFKIAAVLFSISYFLAPLAEHQFPTELIGNFVPDVTPAEVNWAQLVLSTVRRAAEDARLQLSSGLKNISMFGCTHLLEVFYLDNLNFGPSTPYHIILPRASAYSYHFVSELILSDCIGLSDEKLMLFGGKQLRPPSNVCYTRGWHEHTNIQSEHEDTIEEDYLASIELLSKGISFLDKFATELSRLDASTFNVVRESWQSSLACYMKVRSNIDDRSRNLFSKASALLKKRIISLYGHYIPEDVISPSRKRPYIVADDCEQNCTLKFKLHSSKRKAVTTHSNFPTKFNDEMFGHPDVSSINKYICYMWMTDASLPFEELNRNWIVFNTPTPLLITGHEVCHCFKLHHSFTISIVDAVMLLWTYLDAKMCKCYQNLQEPQQMWRHFLPATFSEIVKCDGDYLNSEHIRSCFTGQHITYAVEDCQQFILPILDYKDTWSCYIWDFKLKTITVLDPVLMSTSATKAKDKHQRFVAKLHHALLSCIDNFFSGWDVQNDGWHDVYLTHIGNKCTIRNSGLYAVHYARSFCGRKELAFGLKESYESNLCSARGEILYHFLTCPDNKGYKPDHLLERISYIEI